MSATTTQRSVYVVDDDPLLRRTLTRFLHHEFVVFDGLADDVLARVVRGERFDVILLDVHMQPVDGLTVHALVNQEDPQQAGRIIFMTGGMVRESVERALDELPNMVVQKPFEMPALTRSIARIAFGCSSSRPPP